MRTFETKYLLSALQDYHKDSFTGIIQVDVNLLAQHRKRSRLIAFENGLITYAGLNLPVNQTIIKRLGKHLKRNNIAPAIQLANKKCADGTSILNYLKLFIQLKLFHWTDFEQFMQKSIVWTLEQLLPYSGKAQIAFENQPALNYIKGLPGLNLNRLTSTLDLRQTKWSALTPLIPSIEAVPRCLVLPQSEGGGILKHLQNCIDSQRSLIQIAYLLEQDPLQLALTYHRWIEEGWITCEDSRQAAHATLSIVMKPVRPPILSIDDSNVTQAMIKRSINDRYQVLLANSAEDALNILHGKNVSLILLDVTRSNFDGAELCRTIRSLSKFRDLPVILMTATDRMFDKLKEQSVEATHYLTKPATREKLLEVLDKYVSTHRYTSRPKSSPAYAMPIEYHR